MGADSAVAISAGTGTSIDTYQLAGGDHQQMMQESRSSAGNASTSWTVAVTAATALAADVTRNGLHMYNDSTSATIYVIMGTGTPTLTSYGFPLPPQSYFDCPPWMTRLAVQAIGSLAAGVLHFQIGTIA